MHEAKMSIHSTSLGHSTGLGSNIRFGEEEPLIVRPKVACRLLSVGETRLYELIANGEIESFRDGGSRKITTRSIHAYIERLLNQAQAA
jgi:excisionase family DNA binding protein